MVKLFCLFFVLPQPISFLHEHRRRETRRISARRRRAARAGSHRTGKLAGKFIHSRSSAHDLVTEADIASQKVVKELLSRFLITFFIGEEESGWEVGEAVRPAADARAGVDCRSARRHRRATCTTSPAHCVSIGLWHKGKCWSASSSTRGSMNSSPRARSGCVSERQAAFAWSTISAIANSILSSGFPADYRKQLRNLKVWEKLMEVSQSLRRNGSTSLSMAYVAAGRFDGYWAFDNYPWDVLAGAILITEAGGTLSTTDGLPFDPFRPDLVAE